MTTREGDRPPLRVVGPGEKPPSTSGSPGFTMPDVPVVRGEMQAKGLRDAVRHDREEAERARGNEKVRAGWIMVGACLVVPLPLFIIAIVLGAQAMGAGRRRAGLAIIAAASVATAICLTLMIVLFDAGGG